MAARSPAGSTACRAPRLVREAPARQSIAGAIGLFEASLVPRLAVLAPSMAVAVHSMGGWLFDQAMVGGDAVVFTAEPGDGRAALILGVRARDLTGVLAGPLPRPWVHSVAVHVDLYDRDPRVRRVVQEARQQGSAEVLFCGGPLPAELANAAEPVRYQLSLAARAFKAHAVAALLVEALLVEALSVEALSASVRASDREGPAGPQSPPGPHSPPGPQSPPDPGGVEVFSRVLA